MNDFTLDDVRCIVIPDAAMPDGSILIVFQSVVDAWSKAKRRGEEEQAVAILDEAVRQNRLGLLKNLEGALEIVQECRDSPFVTIGGHEFPAALSEEARHDYLRDLADRVNVLFDELHKMDTVIGTDIFVTTANPVKWSGLRAEAGDNPSLARKDLVNRINTLLDEFYELKDIRDLQLCEESHEPKR